MKILSVLLAVLIFGAIIFIHELGHYLMARLFHVTIKEFSIGMGPQLCSYTSKKSGTVYSLRMLPFGGFVSMDGEDEESSDPNAFCRKAAWKRFLIAAAGASMNLLTGVILAFALMCNMTLASSTVAGFRNDYEVSSETSGLQAGDKILAVDGTSVRIAYEAIYAILHDGYKTVDVTIERDGKILTLPVDFPTTQDESGILYGEPDLIFYAEEHSFGNILVHSFRYSTLTVRMIWEGLFDLITGRVGAGSVSGPVGITSEISNAAVSGNVFGLVYIAIIICMNVGIVNLLPLPALDGGRLLFLLWEMITRKPVPQKYEAAVHGLGLILLFGLMIIITFKDVIGLFG